MVSKVEAVEQLRHVLSANYNARLANFQKTLRREQNLRNSLANLRETSKLARSKPVVEMQSIGADVSWHSWLDKQVRLLNMELAQVLVQKEQETQILRKEFGKKYAGDEIVRAVSKSDRQRRRKIEETSLNEVVLQAFSERTGQE